MRAAEHCGGRGEHDVRHGDRVVGAVVLADPVDVEADLIGQLDLIEQVSKPLADVDLASRRRIEARLGERVESDFHAVNLEGRGALAKERPPRSSAGAAG